MASAGKRQHQVPLIGIGECHAMTASNQVNFYTQDARHGAALKVQGAWSGGCKRPVEMGGGIFVVVALTPYGGWFKEAKEWMS